MAVASVMVCEIKTLGLSGQQPMKIKKVVKEEKAV
jgi:hypothetical protein